MSKNKIYITLTAVCLFCSCLFTACSKRAVSTAEPQTMQALNGRILGVLVSPVVFRPADINRSIGFLPSEVRAFPTSNELVTALKTRRVDGMMTTIETSKFLISADDKLNILPGSQKMKSGLAMILRKADDTLLNELNMAIGILSENGTLVKLYEQYISGVTVNALAQTPSQLSEIPGAQTILVGINGDLPPYDYISAETLHNIIEPPFALAVFSACRTTRNPAVETYSMPLKSRRILLFVSNSGIKAS